MILLDKIIDYINIEKGVDIKTKSRKRNLVELRQVYFYVSKRCYPNISLSVIAGKLNMDHATAIHGIKTFKNTLCNNEKLNGLAIDLVNMIENGFSPEYEKIEDIRNAYNIKIKELEDELHKYKVETSKKIDKDYFILLNMLSPEDLKTFKETRIKPFLRMYGQRRTKTITYENN